MASILYEGPSLLDMVTDDYGVITAGTPIVVLVVYASDNSKTGDMVQTYILRQDMSPTDAHRAGLDTAICGGCIHRSKASGGAGTCYVTKMFINGIWRQYRDGKCEPLDLKRVRRKPIRLGAYGDPAAVPITVWRPLLAASGIGWTGYTHQWRTCDPAYRELCMASCDNDDDQRDADAAGWRVYRVHAIGTPKPAGTIPCPSPRIKCSDCLKCSGTGANRRGHVSIPAHGTSAKRFTGVGISLPLTVT
jgi:hypothetical protein